MTIQERAEALEVFSGGPLKDFEAAGRLQLVTLLEQGLTPQSNVLDVGCGCLRAGWWLMHFLEPGRYFGIEPNRQMLQAGLDEIAGIELVETKRPSFAHNDDFDLSVFGGTFDYVLARSVWTHASKPQIEAMLDSFAAGGHKVLLASYLPAKRRDDYRDAHWVGRSHRSDKSGTVAHRFSWVKAVCAERGLAVEELPGRVFNRQHWLSIRG
jgi:SAM-dependent methyltransferase